MSGKTWEYMHASASIASPQRINFFEERHERLYRGVDLDTIGTHGWELVTVVTVPNKEGQLSYQYFFKRPGSHESVTIYDKQDKLA